MGDALSSLFGLCINVDKNEIDMDDEVTEFCPDEHTGDEVGCMDELRADELESVAYYSFDFKAPCANQLSPVYVITP